MSPSTEKFVRGTGWPALGNGAGAAGAGRSSTTALEVDPGGGPIHEVEAIIELVEFEVIVGHRLLDPADDEPAVVVVDGVSRSRSRRFGKVAHIIHCTDSSSGLDGAAVSPRRSHAGRPPPTGSG